MLVVESVDDFCCIMFDLMKIYLDLKVVVFFGLNGLIGVGCVVKEKCVKNKVVVYGMMIFLQVVFFIKSGDIIEGIIYDLVIVGYVFVVVVSILLNGKIIELGFELKEFGKVEVDSDKYIICFYKVLLVNKDNIDLFY